MIQIIGEGVATQRLVHYHEPCASGELEMIIIITIAVIITIIIIITRPKPAYVRQGLDWIVGPGYNFVVFSTNKTMETNNKP